MKPRGPITPERLKEIGAGDANMYLKPGINRPPKFFMTILGEDLAFDGWHIEINFDDTQMKGHAYLVWVRVRDSAIAFKNVDNMAKLMALYELWSGKVWPGFHSLFDLSPNLDKPVRITGDG